MRYKVSEIEDQIIATLAADTTNFSGVMVNTYAGQVSAQMFMNPEYMQGFITLLPFALVSYQGRVGEKPDRDSALQLYKHVLTFRIFVGAQSRRKTQESARSCYDLLAACFDDLHGKVLVTNPQQMPALTPLSGTALTSTGANPQSPLYETGGADEQLVVNLPNIVVYRTDYSVRLIA